MRLKSHFLAANSSASSSSTKEEGYLVVIAFFTSASFDWLSVKPLSATLEACLSSETGIQSFTAIRVARSSSAAITLLGLDFENAQKAHDLSTSRENHGPWQPGTISRNPPTHARPSSALASVKKDKPRSEKDLQHGVGIVMGP